MEMKEVSRVRLSELMNENKSRRYYLPIEGWQVPILHGLIALVAAHPGVKKLGWPTRTVIAEVRAWCLKRFEEWGFSPEEIEYLDKMREQEQKG